MLNIEKIEELNEEAYLQKNYVNTNHWLWFHGYMILSSIYICPVFTNWSFARIGDSNAWNYHDHNSSSAMYMKYLNTILFALMYLWT